ncbi:hypothetical protein Bca52824_023630 [Brassica carinata]|uniref:RRM domain-containing protein n=1 Tax=Brassica carinata TaxID=52824 RepID=A0A8X7VJ16_BRACI|nr:hypothetical protein Bca52824_023630 [Brassica carinata]
MSSWSSRTIYVGNLPGDIREREVEDLFSKYGPVVQIDLKIPPRPPGYAFVEFEDPRDAEDAIHGRDGYDFDGHCLRVELAHGGRCSSNDARGGASRGGRDGGDRGRGPSRRSEYRVLVSGLPSSASWQDLKDHMRKGGEVCFSQVYRDGRGTTGIVDYTSYEDMKYAIKKLDDTEFRNAFSRGYVRVLKEASKSPSKLSPAKSPMHSRSKNRSRSPSRPRRSHYDSLGGGGVSDVGAPLLPSVTAAAAAFKRLAFDDGSIKIGLESGRTRLVDSLSLSLMSQLDPFLLKVML